MWTPATRAQLVRPIQPYATCLTDAEWAIAQTFLPPPSARGRRRRWPMRLLLDAVSPADLHDSHGGIALLQASRRPWPFIALCWADHAYAGPRVANATPITVELVGPKPDQRAFAVQPRR